MTNQEMLQVAMQQSALDIGCNAVDFLTCINKVVPLYIGENAKKYYCSNSIACNFVSFGNNVVVATKNEVRDTIQEYVNKYEFYRCFETPSLLWLSDHIKVSGQTIWLMAEFYLPDVNRLKRQLCQYDLCILNKSDLLELNFEDWPNALCCDRKELTVLGFGAYEGNRLIGLAAATADALNMWQIGVDVIQGFRRKGIATALTSNLATEILKRNIVPFYNVSWANISSKRNAIKSGFYPAWTEMIVKSFHG